MRKFILGTDWWDDCDDVMAVRLLTRAIRNGEAQLLGVGINACMEYSVASLKGFLNADKVFDIPIGIDLEADDFGGQPSYQKRLAETFGAGIQNTDAEDGVRLYRRILAAAEEKIEILEIGFLQIVANLLNSQADDISEKSGLQLVSEKVSKFWVMAGNWSADGEIENNFCRNNRSRVAANIFCKLCPVPVTFLGFEIGNRVITGGQLDRSDHLYQVLSDHGSSGGRCSWDPMLVLMALIGDEKKAGYETVRGKASVDPQNGRNYFVRSSDGSHQFVIKKHDNHFYEEQINRLL